jgi:hypothetical protein
MAACLGGNLHNAAIATMRLWAAHPTSRYFFFAFGFASVLPPEDFALPFEGAFALDGLGFDGGFALDEGASFFPPAPPVFFFFFRLSSSSSSSSGSFTFQALSSSSKNDSSNDPALCHAFSPAQGTFNHGLGVKHIPNASQRYKVSAHALNGGLLCTHRNDRAGRARVHLSFVNVPFERVSPAGYVACL